MTKTSVINFPAFSAALSAFAKQATETDVVKVQKKLVLDALRGIVQRTPVDTGRARANWQVTLDVAASGQLAEEDKSGGSTITAGLSALAGLSPNRVVWITNNVDYILFLEDGSSTQAPEGMVAVTVNELELAFKAVA